MISFKYISHKDFMKNHSPINPTKEVIERFSEEIELLLKKAFMQDDEEFQKNEINKFLGRVYDYDCNTKGKVDSAIYIEGEAQVLIEAKSLKRKNEFPKDTPLSKALYESILYFLREKRKYDNNSIKHIILANPYEFYIFDATSFEIFQKDKKIDKLYKNCDGKEGTDKSNPKFYKDLERYLKGEFEGELAYTHFSLKDKLHTQELTAICQLLSPQVLLKARKILDANTLNKSFYEELLYILGLKEVNESGKSGGKTIIKPSHTPSSLSDAIIKAYDISDEETIFTLITTWNNRILFLALLESMLLGFKHINKPFLDYSIIKDFGTLQSLFFDVLAQKTEARSPSLISEFASIPYLNSSLFDRIDLEKEGKNIGGLYPSSLQLFSHSILKKDARFKEKDSLPFLEYLFEFLHAYDFTTTPKDIEQGVKQNHDKLINSAVLGLVFEKLNGYKEGSFYTPSFITSYMCKESITQAVIEKFNQAYKWEVTSLEEISSYSVRCKLSAQELLSVLLSLRVCDPSVGSGHFLVSALNEIVKIAYELGLISSFKNNTTLELENDEILIKTHNDFFIYTRPSSPQEPSHKIQMELFNLKKSIIENCLFGVDINPNSCEITKLRLWIELLKYSYYLFDENGNNTNALETLPNIDINIKCGNSLISYFDLNQSLTHYPNIKAKIQIYKNMVKNYKEGFFSDKTKLSSQIEELLITFQKFCFKDKYKKEIQAFQKQCDKYRELYGNYLAKDDCDLALYISENPFPKYEHIDETQEEIHKQANKDFSNLKQAYNALYNLSSNNPFEWRFAFPEVLDDEGSFLGFDCIIGNPPYISAPSQEENPQLSNQRKILSLSKRFESLYQKWDLYIPFIELGISQLCKENAICSMIVPYPLTNQTYGKKLREILTSRFNLYELTDLRGKKIFESATVTNCIIFAKKQLPLNTLAISQIDENLKITKQFEKSYSELIQDEKTQVWNTTQEKRVSSRHSNLNVLGDFCYVSKGMVLHSNERKAKGEFKKEDLISDTQDEIYCKPYIEAKDFEKYRIKRVRYLEYGTERCPKNIDRPTFEELYINKKIMINKLGELKVCIDTKGYLFCEQTIRVCVLWKDLASVENRSIKDTLRKYSRLSKATMEKLSEQMDLRYLLGILNSRYSNKLLDNLRGNDFNIYPEHIRNLPIPKITESNQEIADKIIALVEEILALKESNPKANTQKLEQEIDSLVYTLYNLTKVEIKIIEEGR